MSLQSHKNPCSVAALLCGNFGSLVDFVEILTKIHSVLSQTSYQVSPCFCDKTEWILVNFPPSVELFSWKISIKKNFLFCWKFFTKTFWRLVGNFHKKFPLWLISRKNAFIANHTIVAFMKNFHKTLFGWKIFTTTGFVEIFFAKSCFVRPFSQHFV